MGNYLNVNGNDRKCTEKSDFVPFAKNNNWKAIRHPCSIFYPELWLSALTTIMSHRRVLTLLSLDLATLVTIVEPIRYQTYLIPNQSDTKPISYWICEIPNLSDTKPIRYRACQISNLSDTDPIRYQIYPIPELSDDDVNRYKTYQTQNVSDTDTDLSETKIHHMETRNFLAIMRGWNGEENKRMDLTHLRGR